MWGLPSMSIQSTAGWKAGERKIKKNMPASLYKVLLQKHNVDEVDAIQFGVLGPEEILNQSAVEILTHETWDSNMPKIGGLFDPRMGVIEHGRICSTCKQRNDLCPGHFGHLKLASKVFWIQYLPMVQKVLKCVCWTCSKLLIPYHPDDPQKYNDIMNEILRRKNSFARFTYVYNLCRNATGKNAKRCDGPGGCNQLQPFKTVRENTGGAKIFLEFNSTELTKDTESRINVSANDCHRIFKRITDEDLEILGFSEKWCLPHWLICDILPISPPAVRPSVSREGNQRAEDDITHKLADIIKINNTLKQRIQQNSRIDMIDDYTNLLQYHVGSLIDNELPGVPQAAHRSGRPLKTHRQRLKGKEGRIRGHLMGKRVDFSARCQSR